MDLQVEFAKACCWPRAEVRQIGIYRALEVTGCVTHVLTSRDQSLEPVVELQDRVPARGPVGTQIALHKFSEER